MEVSTKFNVGEVVWYYAHDGLKKFQVDSISITAKSKSQVSIEYLGATSPGTIHEQIKKTEDKVFASKEDLIKTL